MGGTGVGGAAGVGDGVCVFWSMTPLGLYGMATVAADATPFLSTDAPAGLCDSADEREGGPKEASKTTPTTKRTVIQAARRLINQEDTPTERYEC